MFSNSSDACSLICAIFSAASFALSPSGFNITFWEFSKLSDGCLSFSGAAVLFASDASSTASPSSEGSFVGMPFFTKFPSLSKSMLGTAVQISSNIFLP